MEDVDNLVKNNGLESLQNLYSKTIEIFREESELRSISFEYWNANLKLYQIGKSSGLVQSSMVMDFASLLLDASIKCSTPGDAVFLLNTFDEIKQDLASGLKRQRTLD